MSRKKDIKQVDAVAREFGIEGEDRHEFGDFLETCKADGQGGTKNERGTSPSKS